MKIKRKHGKKWNKRFAKKRSLRWVSSKTRQSMKASRVKWGVGLAS